VTSTGPGSARKSTAPKSAPTTPSTRLDKDAASRFVKHSVGSAKKHSDNREEKGKEKEKEKGKGKDKGKESKGKEKQRKEDGEEKRGKKRKSEDMGEKEKEKEREVRGGESASKRPKQRHDPAPPSPHQPLRPPHS